MNDDPIRPTEKQITCCDLMGWSYDEESFLFERDGDIGFFSTEGFIKL